MKTIFSAMLMSASLGLAAQQVEVRYSHPEWEAFSTKPKGDKHRVDVYSTTKKGNRLEQSYSFNDKGLIDLELIFKNNGKVAKQYTREYNDAGKTTLIRSVKNNKLKNLYQYTYLHDTLYASYKMYYKDTLVPRRINECEYDANNKMKLQAGYNGKKEQLYRYEYDYYENGSRKETRHYQKGKLKHSWVYDCELKGELLTSNTEKVCKNRVYEADGSFTEVYENTVKGKVTRSIVKSAADGRVLERNLFNAKGKLLSKSVYQYNQNNKLVKHIQYKHNTQQPKFIEMYEYNSDNSLVASLRVDQGGSVKYRREYAYN